MRDVYGARYGASELAEPLITPDEVEGDVPTTVCRIHKGHIANGLAAGDRYGRVYYCPIGKMLWRLTERVSGMNSPLRFPKGL
jgi:hypothetical protein